MAVNVKRFCLAFLGIVLFNFSLMAGTYRVAFDVESKVSGGDLSIGEILNIARKKHIDAVILGERFCSRFSYGLWPFRKIIKIKRSFPSVCTYGFRKYFDLVDKAQKEFPDVLLIRGFEVSPYYLWRGSLTKGLTLLDWHRQFIVTGLNYRELLNLPVVATGKSRYSSYKTDYWYRPYQEFIDYVNQKGGLCFWAHPDAANVSKEGRVNIITLAYSEMLLKTKQYTGFAILFGGQKQSGVVGGNWDKALIQYCEGKRKRPVLAIGDLDYSEAEKLNNLDELLNFVIAKKKSKKSLLAALRKGKYYVSWNMHKKDVYLSDFLVYDSITSEETHYSGVLESSSGKITVKIILTAPFGEKNELQIKLLKNGRLFDIKIAKGKGSFFFKDNISPKSIVFYRAVIEGKNAKIITNPLFVKRQ